MNGCSSDLPKGASNEAPFVHYYEVQSMKPFTNIDEQIELLKSRNLTFINESLARQSLTNYGYYEIVNGYKYFTIELDLRRKSIKMVKRLNICSPSMNLIRISEKEL